MINNQPNCSKSQHRFCNIFRKYYVVPYKNLERVGGVSVSDIWRNFAQLCGLIIITLLYVALLKLLFLFHKQEFLENILYESIEFTGWTLNFYLLTFCCPWFMHGWWMVKVCFTFYPLPFTFYLSSFTFYLLHFTFFDVHGSWLKASKRLESIATPLVEIWDMGEGEGKEVITGVHSNPLGLVF